MTTGIVPKVVTVASLPTLIEQLRERANCGYMGMAEACSLLREAAAELERCYRIITEADQEIEQLRHALVSK